MRYFAHLKRAPELEKSKLQRKLINEEINKIK